MESVIIFAIVVLIVLFFIIFNFLDKKEAKRKIDGRNKRRELLAICACLDFLKYSSYNFPSAKKIGRNNNNFYLCNRKEGYEGTREIIEEEIRKTYNFSKIEEKSKNIKSNFGGYIGYLEASSPDEWFVEMQKIDDIDRIYCNVVEMLIKKIKKLVNDVDILIDDSIFLEEKFMSRIDDSLENREWFLNVYFRERNNIEKADCFVKKFSKYNASNVLCFTELQIAVDAFGKVVGLYLENIAAVKELKKMGERNIMENLKADYVLFESVFNSDGYRKKASRSGAAWRHSRIED